MISPTIVAAGDMCCSECNIALPAVEVWAGRRVLQCGKKKCRLSAKKRTSQYVYVSAGTTRCDNPGCNNYVPEGTYDKRSKFKVCCGACYRKRQLKGYLWFTCSHCGDACLGRPWSKRHFCSNEHQALFTVDEAHMKCGAFATIMKEYLDGWAKIHYRGIKTVRASLLAFCEFLIEKRVPSLDHVDPRVITQYLAWGISVKRKQVPYSMSAVATFFNWMIAEGRRTTPNPVVATMHYPSTKRRNPRPLDRRETALAWTILDGRGTNLQRLAFAIGIEGGLRIGEIVNLRLADIDELRQTIFVRLPNKAMRERITFYHDKTKEHLKAWMEERSTDCDHDYVFANKWNRPASTDMLRRQFNDLFCDPDEELRFDNWSTHRLRHSFATGLANAGGKVATISAIGGWSSMTTMLGYVDADEGIARQGYIEAMRINEERKAEPSTAEFSLDDYLNMPTSAQDSTPTV